MGAKPDDDLPRVLFLHSIDAGPSGSKQRLIQRSVGRERFLAPNLRTRQMLLLFTAVYAVFCLLCLVGAVICWIFTSAALALLVTASLLATVITLYYFGGKWVSRIIINSAVRTATEAFEDIRPQVIVAVSFGAVVAFHMDVPKMPMLLFTPAQQLYQRYTQSDAQISLRNYPYTLIVHGSRDKVVSLEDSIRLVETSELGRCRLEVVDDDHQLRSLSQQELSSWIEEVYKRGRVNVRALAEGGDTNVDPSYFENIAAVEEEEDEDESEVSDEKTNHEKRSIASVDSSITIAGDDTTDGGHRARLASLETNNSQDVGDNDRLYPLSNAADTAYLLQ